MSTSLILKLTSPVVGSRGASGSQFRTVLANYMDDTGKGMLDRSNSYFLEPEERLPALRQRAEKQDASKTVVVNRDDTRGMIEAHGFLETHLRRRNIAPTSPAQREERKEWVDEVSMLWLELAGRYATQVGVRRPKNYRTRLGYRWVGSVSDEALATMAAKGMSATDVLRDVTEKTWKAYCRSRGWENDQLGWLTSFHYDKEHFHCHMLVFPRSKSGETLNFSDRAMVGDDQRINYLTNISTNAAQYMEEAINPPAVGRVPQNKVTMKECSLRLVQSRFLMDEYIDRGGDACAAEMRQVIKNEWLGSLRKNIGSENVPADDSVDWFLPIMVHRTKPADKPVAPEEEQAQSQAEARWWMRVWLGYRSEELNRRKLTDDETVRMRTLLKDLRDGGSDVENAAQLKRRIEALQGGVESQELPLAVARDGAAWQRHLARECERWLARGEIVMREYLSADAVALRINQEPSLKLMFSEQYLPIREQEFVGLRQSPPAPVVEIGR